MVESVRSSFDSELVQLTELYEKHFPCDYTTRGCYIGEANCPFFKATISLAKTFHNFGATEQSRKNPDNLQRYLSLSPEQRQRAKELGLKYASALESAKCKECTEGAHLELQLAEHMRVMCWEDLGYQRQKVEPPVIKDPELFAILKTK